MFTLPAPGHFDDSVVYIPGQIIKLRVLLQVLKTRSTYRTCVFLDSRGSNFLGYTVPYLGEYGVNRPFGIPFISVPTPIRIAAEDGRVPGRGDVLFSRACRHCGTAADAARRGLLVGDGMSLREELQRSDSGGPSDA